MTKDILRPPLVVLMSPLVILTKRLIVILMSPLVILSEAKNLS